MLHVAINLLCRKKLPNELIKFCKQLLDKYINDFKTIFGKHHIVYVVHALCHLAENVEHHGNLDQFSSFPFESFNYKIKKMLRKHELPLAQMHRRLEELENIEEKVENEDHFPKLKNKFYDANEKK